MFWFLLACSNPVDHNEVITGIEDIAGWNPVDPSLPAFPFPSHTQLKPAATATGFEVSIPPDALPEGVPADLLSENDGFSRAPVILCHLEGGVASSSLPDPLDHAATLADDSPVFLVRVSSGERVPVLAEADGNTAQTPFQQALILRPHFALAPDEAYVVVLTQQLTDLEGRPHTPSEAFRALRDGLPTDASSVEAQRGDYEAVNAVIDELPIAREDVVLAWSFHTRSEEGLSSALLHMHDVLWTAPLPPFTLLSDSTEGDTRLIRGLLEVPTFLDEDRTIMVDANGRPVQQGTYAMEFLVTIPSSVEGPRPVLAFGHGFFASLEEPTWSSLSHSLREWRMSAVAIDFIGFNEDDLSTAFAALTGDLRALRSIGHQQMQSQAMFTAVYRLITEQLAPTEEVLDGGRVHYLGISNGGTQGTAILAASPAPYARGALIVNGGGWAHMMQRAVQFNSLSGVLQLNYPDALEQQLVLSLSQLVFDPIDAINHADHLVDNRYAGRPPLDATMHIAVADTQVSNLVSAWVARTAGVPLVTPSALEIWGLERAPVQPDGSVNASSALFVYDEGYEPLPVDNVPPAEENGAHDSIRALDAYHRQVGSFLETGELIQVCDGPCDPD